MQTTKLIEEYRAKYPTTKAAAEEVGFAKEVIRRCEVDVAFLNRVATEYGISPEKVIPTLNTHVTVLNLLY